MLGNFRVTSQYSVQKSYRVLTTRPCDSSYIIRDILFLFAHGTCLKMATVLLGGRKLADLRVVDLRQELEKRGLEKSGVKAVLLERLQKVTCTVISRKIHDMA